MELTVVEDSIAQKEQELAGLLPEWERLRGVESNERRQLDEARARLDALYAKRGRLDKFRTKAERDHYLRAEIAGMEQFRKSQANALSSLEEELKRGQQSLKEVNDSMNATQQRVEDARNSVKNLGEEIAKLKDEQAEKTERRKELWREDAKLESLVAHAADEVRSADRMLASMMDKVCCVLWQPQHHLPDSIFYRILATDSVLSIVSPTNRASPESTVLSTGYLRSPTRSSTLQLNSLLATGL